MYNSWINNKKFFNCIKMKSFTDLEQSKILVTFLPPDTADMYYKKAIPKSGNVERVLKVGNPVDALDSFNKVYAFSEKKEPICMEDFCIPCWSLAALRALIPKGIDIQNYLAADTDKDVNRQWIYTYKLNPENNINTFISAANEVDICFNVITDLHSHGIL